jgi:hypothetical protein
VHNTHEKIGMTNDFAADALTRNAGMAGSTLGFDHAWRDVSFCRKRCRRSRRIVGVGLHHGRPTMGSLSRRPHLAGDAAYTGAGG